MWWPVKWSPAGRMLIWRKRMIRRQSINCAGSLWWIRSTISLKYSCFCRIWTLIKSVGQVYPISYHTKTGEQPDLHRRLYSTCGNAGTDCQPGIRRASRIDPHRDQHHHASRTAEVLARCAVRTFPPSPGTCQRLQAQNGQDAVRGDHLRHPQVREAVFHPLGRTGKIRSAYFSRSTSIEFVACSIHNLYVENFENALLT